MFENFPFSPKKEEEKKTSVDTLRSEHLLPGVPPIYFCLETFDDKSDDNKESVGRKVYKKKRGFYLELDDSFDYVDFYGTPEHLVYKNFKNPSFQTYVISPISEKDKVSRLYENCNGVLVTGIDRISGKNISFLSHEDPKVLFPEGKEKTNEKQKEREKIIKQFSLDLKERLNELKERCVPGTIDAVVFGGNYFFENNKEDKGHRKNYTNSINLVSSEISSVLGFSPVVVAGPKFVSIGDNLYYNNEQRRAFLMRPEIGNTGTESYLPEDIKKQEEKWRKEQVKNEQIKSVWEHIKEVFD